MEVLCQWTSTQALLTLSLTTSYARLKYYSGQEVKVCGELMVNAVYGEQQVKFPLLVVWPESSWL